MNDYTKNKAREISNELNKMLRDGGESLSNLEDLIELKIKEVMRDTRHAAAENILKVGNDFNTVKDVDVINACHSAVIRTNLK